MATVLDRLHAETEAFHAEADEDGLLLLGPVASADYQRFLRRTYGFLAPVERSLQATAGLEAHIDRRRFNKHELVRRDLLAFSMRPDEIERLPRCTVPLFDSAEEAFGWAYVIERATLGHTNLFRHLAMAMPGEVAFTSAYLKCYFGSVGEMWRAFGVSVERFAEHSRAHVVIESAKTAFRTLRAFRHHQDDRESPVEEQRSA